MGMLVQSGIHIEHYEPHCQTTCAADPCSIDVRRASWIDAFAVVGIATHIQQNYRRGRRTVLSLPEDDRVSAYLTEMGLEEVAADHGVEIKGHFSRPRRRRRKKADRLVPLQRVHDDPDRLAELNELVRDRLVPNADGGPSEATLWQATEEVAGNALRHSGASPPPFLAAQAYGKTGDLVVAVGDTGVGIPRSLQARHPVRDDGDALRKAVTRGVSAADDGSGDGLADLTEEVARLGGTVVLRSGTATMQVRGRRARPPKACMRQRGTVVGARIPWIEERAEARGEKRVPERVEQGDEERATA